MKHADGSCELRKVMSFDTERAAPMNCAVFKDDKNYTVAMGMDDRCFIYSLRHKIITPKKGVECKSHDHSGHETKISDVLVIS